MENSSGKKHTSSIFPDMNSETSKERREFREVFALGEKWLQTAFYFQKTLFSIAIQLKKKKIKLLRHI